ncbi:Type 1 glutamine amidotransferase-like domain-containing protein [Cytobacillus massiliigabonensis]|uniref:Type 1 glutamine amidotransferase-like domain-containing protein n=1 Tax=Cytobacillus massiliigabonensis TaxID=1871011 RepID=UPI000C85D57F|nr:Type 1 glutamine amidotransferase-like domain-containing protein [Cytobacillus massiliigabonensis]
MNTHLFLFGGSPPFTNKMAKLFIEKLKDKTGPLSILFVDREGWEGYMPKYTSAMEEYSINNFYLLPLPTTPVEQVIQAIQMSSGIIIGGGDTNLYADYLVDTPISNIIKDCFLSGVPVAGFSAGALISSNHCVISPKDNPQKEFQHRKGLGLITDHLLAVHFTEWNDENHLRNAVNYIHASSNYGIDEKTGAYFLNGHLAATEGKGVYSIENNVLVKISKNSF